MFAKIWHKISQFWKNCQIVVLIVRKVIKNDVMKIGSRLKSLRIEKQLEPLDMAIKIGVSETTFKPFKSIRI